jgi:hypothetical protein
MPLFRGTLTALKQQVPEEVSPMKEQSVSLKFFLISLLASLPLASVEAHHSRAMFDIDNTIEIEGVVSLVRWRSPHVYWGVEVTNAQSETEEWMIEGHSISGLMGNGWQPDSVQTGDHVRVIINPSRDESRHFGLLDYFRHDDGRIFYSFRPPEGTQARERVENTAPITPSTDFSGTWIRTRQGTAEESLRSALVGNFDAPDPSSLTPIGQALVANFDLNDDPYLDCVPLGVPRIITWPYAHRWSREDNRLILEKEQSPQVRVVYFNQPEPPADYVPNELGYSTGRILDDGTLQITTQHFAPTKWGTIRGLDSSEQKTVVEEYTLADDGLSMRYVFTVSDPIYLTEPLMTSGAYRKTEDHAFTTEQCDIETSRQHLQFE